MKKKNKANKENLFLKCCSSVTFRSGLNVLYKVLLQKHVFSLVFETTTTTTTTKIKQLVRSVGQFSSLSQFKT